MASETLMKDGDWLIRRDDSIDKHWVSHTGCFDLPRVVKKGKCHHCKAPAPEVMMGFLDMVNWEI